MNQLIRIQEVIRRTGLSRSAVYELAQRGDLPQQVKLSEHGRSAAWVSEEIDEFIAGRIAARDSGKGGVK